MAAIGIMGGTFNPIHIGHIEIAKAAFTQYDLDEIWFMPNHIPGYKPDYSLASGQDRLKMVQLAIADIPDFKVSDYELKRPGNTYTAETLALLSEDYPEDDFYFIMGGDSLDYFDKWKCPEIIVKHATILAAPRDNISMLKTETRINELNEIYSGNHFQLIRCKNIPCSSSEIRNRLFKMHQKDDADKVNVPEKMASELYLPLSVYTYIINHKLYF